MRMLRRVANWMRNAAGIGLLFIVAACSNEAPLSSDQANNDAGQKSAGNVVQSDIGPIKLLRSNPLAVTLGTGSGSDGVFYAEKYIEKGHDGQIVVGDNTSGYTTLTIPQDAVPTNMTISVQWSVTGINELVFEPHGVSFMKPLLLSVSYKTADLSGMDESSLRLFYEKDSDLWKLIGGVVNQENKQVNTSLNHFSRYALGGE